MNKVELIGRLTKDIELRMTTESTAIARFTLAVNRRKKDEADFITCKAFGKTAELLDKYTRKGDRIGMCGRIETGKYNDKDGNTVYTTEVIADDIDLLEPKREEPKQEEKLPFNLGGEELPF